MCENCKYCAGYDIYGEPVCCKNNPDVECEGDEDA